MYICNIYIYIYIYIPDSQIMSCVKALWRGGWRARGRPETLRGDPTACHFLGSCLCLGDVTPLKSYPDGVKLIHVLDVSMGNSRACLQDTVGSHNVNLQNVNVRVSNPGIIAYAHFEMPFESSNLLGSGPLFPC